MPSPSLCLLRLRPAPPDLSGDGSGSCPSGRYSLAEERVVPSVKTLERSTCVKMNARALCQTRRVSSTKTKALGRNVYRAEDAPLATLAAIIAIKNQLNVRKQENLKLFRTCTAK
ncbi:hypothetical protein NDU88_003440 [Pleurodeles waltl]|uniref:Uncharacterized protein n=1 Tax=Pleurodeles waltl TaxID=8319 RepID=A0AAV7TR53_PLEWA|nr:hypothetical protein NDU88_003440 [Pleurodeles waltl]